MLLFLKHEKAELKRIHLAMEQEYQRKKFIDETRKKKEVCFVIFFMFEKMFVIIN